MYLCWNCAVVVPKEHPEKEKEKEVRPAVSLVSYRQFFRELDMEVLSVLQCGLLSCSVLDSNLQTEVGTAFKQTWPFLFSIFLVSF